MWNAIPLRQGDIMRPLLSLRSVSFSYNGSSPILEEIDFELNEGERIGLIGPNGCGKTTFLQLCVGLLRPIKGKVFFKGRPVSSEEDLWELRKNIGFVFQNPDDQLFSPTVLEDVAFGPLNLGMKKDEAIKRAKETLKLVGLKGFEDRLTHKLSGGEKRLVSIATVLSMRPKAMLLDEPSTGLDPETRKRLIDLLNRLDMALLIVSHDWDFVVRTTDRYFTIEDHKIVEIKREVLHQHLHYHPAGDIPHEHLYEDLNKSNKTS